VEFTVALGLGGWVLLMAGALVFGVVAQYVGETRTGYTARRWAQGSTIRRPGR
jgi:hypothetical protein